MSFGSEMAHGSTAPFVSQNVQGQWKEEHSGIDSAIAEPSTPCNEAMSSLLRQYNSNLDPQPTGLSRKGSPPESSSLSSSSKEGAQSKDAIFPLHSPKSFFDHRRGADHLPQQSILKAIASRPPGSAGLPSISLAASLARGNDWRLMTPSENKENKGLTPATARFATLQSPCFFHQRFEDAVNIERVLEEVNAESDGMSHSRLIQTATSVREISKQLQRRPIKRAVRSVMIVTKARDNSLVYLTRDLALWLMGTPRYGSDLGVNVYVDAKLQKSKRFDAAGIVAENPRFASMLKYWDPDLCWTSPELFDLVLTLGGDGTVLFTSFCLFQRVVPPVLAFSLGSLGFLTNFEYANYRNSLNKIMGDDGMRVNLRMRFTCTVFRAGSRPKGSKISPVDTAHMVEGEQFEVLNELVIDRGPSPYVSNLELYGDDELLTVVQADGCIFSTPTGSTAYSLSAGGPLTHPSIPGIMLTPICPHTLSFRPMVLSDSLMLKVCIPRGSRSTAYASFDGKHRVELRRGDCVQVEAGRYPFPTVVGEHGTGGEWFDSVRRALRWNTRGAMQKAFSSSKHVPVINEVEAGEEVDGGDEEEEEEEEEADEEWDIDADPVQTPGGLDSGLGASEVSSNCTSPSQERVSQAQALVV